MLFPTPFTPTKVMTYGRPASFAARTSRSTSTDRFGVRMRVNASSIASLVIAPSEEKLGQFLPSERRRDGLAQALGDVLGDVLVHEVGLELLQHGHEVVPVQRGFSHHPAHQRVLEQRREKRIRLLLPRRPSGVRRRTTSRRNLQPPPPPPLPRSCTPRPPLRPRGWARRCPRAPPLPRSSLSLGLPSEKSRPSVLPFAFSPAQTRFSFSFFFFPSFPSRDPRRLAPARFEPLPPPPLLPPPLDFKDARILDISNAPVLF